uniref:Cadherin domain-containing protein n=1 Tax=Scophthalmus maximus TaxID=52904 RepID=A0A8D2ZHX1_SCOMX
MDGVQPHSAVRTSFIFLLLILLQTSSGLICSAPMSVEFEENNKVDDVVATITVQPKVTLVLDPNLADLFNIRGNQLVAARVFDFETGKTYTARMTCNDTATGSQLKLTIVVVLTNVNDNPPVFGQKLYHLDVTELSPVGTTVGRYAATDPDKPDQLFYTLTSESNNFRLESATNPDLVIARTLDYDNVKNIKLVLSAQDTPLSASNGISFTATTTIMVTVLDRDNRPPWFQPCTRQEIGVTVVCQSAGYTGEVVLNEPEPGVLPLEPGPLYAIDGDSGINEQLTYSFLSGNDERLFEINAASGNISMLKPAKTMDTINLEVLAIQKLNSHQFATTTVTIRVKVKSLHPPQFQKSQYRGVITSMGTRAMDGDKPLYIHATDQDFNELPNPHIVYSINGSRDFSIINGYIFMDKDLPPDTLTLRVVATDTSNGDSDTAQLMLQVKSGLTTTSLPLSTTNIMATTPIGESSTTDSKTTDYIVSTTNPIVTTESSISTTIPSTTDTKTTEGIVSTTTKPNVSTDSSISTTTRSTTDSIISTTHSIMSTAPEGSDPTTNASVTSEASNSTASTDHPPTGSQNVRNCKSK